MIKYSSKCGARLGFASLLVAASIFLLSQLATLALAEVKRDSANGAVTRLPFDKVAPLPGGLSISGNGDIAAHVAANGDVVLWRPASGERLEAIAADGKKPSAVALSADGDSVAIGYFDSRVAIWSRRTRSFVRELNGHVGGVSALAFSPDGRRLASGADDATAQLWDIHTGRRLQVFDSMLGGSYHGGIVVALGFSGDGRALVVNEWYSRHYDVQRGVTVWDVDDGIEITANFIAPPNTDDVMRAGQAIGGNGWLLAYTGPKGLQTERLDVCGAPPRLLPDGGYADTVAADRQGRWVAASAAESLIFFGASGDTQGRPVALPAKSIALAAHPDGRSVFALAIASTQSTGNESFVFGRSAFTVTGGAIYRIAVPEPLWRSPPLTVPASAVRCPPAEAVRAVQGFRVPDKPAELSILARLKPPRVSVGEPDPSQRDERPEKRLQPWGPMWSGVDDAGNPIIADARMMLKHLAESSSLNLGAGMGANRAVGWHTPSLRAPQSDFVVVDLKHDRLEWRTTLPVPIGHFEVTELAPNGGIFAFSQIQVRRGGGSEDGDDSIVHFLDLERRQPLARLVISRLFRESPRILAIEALSQGRFAVLAGRGQLVFWDAPAGRELASHRFERVFNTRRMAVTADGRRLAVIVPTKSDANAPLDEQGQANEIRLYDSDGRLVKDHAVPNTVLLTDAANFSADGRYVILEGSGKRSNPLGSVIAVWDTHENRLLKFEEKSFLQAREGRARISRDGRELAVDMTANKLTLFELPTGRRIQELPNLSSAFLSSDFRWVYHDDGRNLTVYSTRTGHKVDRYEFVSPLPLRWSDDSRALEAMEGERFPRVAQRLALRLPDDPTQATPPVEVPPGPARELRFTRDGMLYARYELSADNRRYSGVAVWDPRAQRPVQARYKDHGNERQWRLRDGWAEPDDEAIYDMLTGKSILSLGDRSYPGLITSDQDSGELYRIVSATIERYAADGRRLPNVAAVKKNALAIAARNGTLTVLFADGQVQRWKTQAGGEPKTFGPILIGDRDSCEIGEAAVSVDGRYLQIPFSCVDSPTDYPIFDLKSAKQVAAGPLLTPFLGRSNRGVVQDGRLHRVAVWDLDKARIIARLPRHRSRDKSGAYQVLTVAMSDDGRLVASAAPDGSVRVWDIDARQMLGEAKLGAAITAMAFDSSGRLLAAATDNAQIALLELAAQTLLTTEKAP